MATCSTPCRPCACAWLTQQDARRRFAGALLNACWSGEVDVSDDTVLQRLANACGLNGVALHAAAQQSELKMALAEDTAQAVAAGVFGVPTFKLGDALFWGGDRSAALIRVLRGKRIDEQALADFLAKRPLAQRQRQGSR